LRNIEIALIKAFFWAFLAMIDIIIAQIFIFTFGLVGLLVLNLIWKGLILNPVWIFYQFAIQALKIFLLLFFTLLLVIIIIIHSWIFIIKLMRFLLISRLLCNFTWVRLQIAKGIRIVKIFKLRLFIRRPSLTVLLSNNQIIKMINT